MDTDNVDNNDKKATDAEQQEEDIPKTDDEGLLLEYDVIICGTGLVQSILASALARVGKSVLHCDSQSFYGELDAVVSFNQLVDDVDHELFSEDENEDREETVKYSSSRIALRTRPIMRRISTHKTSKAPFSVGAKVITPYGRGTVMALPSKDASLAISLDNWNMGSGRYMFVGVDSTENLDVSHKIQSVEQITLDRILHQQHRSFAMDLSPQLIFASGKAVEGFLTSNVAEYLEFKSVEGLLWSQDQKLSPVPCSKGEVFASKLLAPLDKRRLMKFMQLIMDYGTSLQMKELFGSGEDQVNDESTGALHVQELNELHLNQGRSLARPQNKAVSTTQLDQLKTIMSENKLSLAEYLSKEHKLSDKLSGMIRYAIALERDKDETEDVNEGVRRITSHLQGLGRYGTTAFLQPIYGSGEFSQAFCRSAAVHGATYLLRRQPKEVILHSKDDGSKLPRCVESVVLRDDEGEGTEKAVRCKHVVCPMHLIQQSRHTKLQLRRISILTKPIVADSKEQRHILLVPPTDRVNNPIQGLVLDWNSRVAASGSTLLHLMTVVDEGGDTDVLDEAAKTLVADDSNEIYHISFSYPIYDSLDDDSIEGTEGLFVCGSSRGLVADDAFAEAKSMFELLCPNENFLSLSQAMDTTIRERNVGLQEEDDDEKMALQAAVDLISKEPMTEE